MRLREYKTNTHQDGMRVGGDRSTARADVLASQGAHPRLADLPSQANPRMIFEDFDGDRFIAEPVEPYVNQAIDIIEAFDKAWFGERRINGFGRGFNASLGSQRDLITAPPPPLQNRSSRRFHQAPAPPAMAPTSTTPPDHIDDNTSNTPPNNQQQEQLKSRFSWNNQTSSPIPTVTPEQQRQAQILQELPGIGTWAGRQRLFSVRPLPQVPNSQIEDQLLVAEASETFKPLQSSTPTPAATENGHVSGVKEAMLTNGYSAAAEEEDTLSDMVKRRLGNGYTRHQELLDDEDKEQEDMDLMANRVPDAIINAAMTPSYTLTTTLQRTGSNTSSEARHISAAWKWRFTRRWEAEQRRVMETDPTVIAAEGDAGDGLDALEYLHACGMGLDLQMLDSIQQQQQQQQRRNGRGRGGRGATAGGGRGTAPPGRVKSGIINAPEPTQRTSGFSTPLRRDASSVSTITMQFEVEPSYASVGDLVSCEGSENISSYLLTPDTGNASNPAAATRDLLSVAVRGRELLQRQTELEREAAAKWEEIERNCCGGASIWAGNVVPPVDIAMHGKFYFVVLRMSEIGGGGGLPSTTGSGGASGSGGGSGGSSGSPGGRNGFTSFADNAGMNRSSSTGANRQRMLVRGRPKATPQELLEETIAQASSACAERMLPYVSITLVGAGEMEWREDTDRHLMVSPATRHVSTLKTKSGRNGGGGGGVANGGSPPDAPLIGDVCALAASLLHQALPLHFNISTRAQSLATYAGGTVL